LLCKHVDNTIYFSEHHKLVEKLLKRSTTVIAVDPNDPATIYGYLTYERLEGILVVHYSYVKHTFRGMGVLRQLLKSIEHDWNTAGLFTHSTIISARLSLKYNLIYHPYILINYNESPQESKNEVPVETNSTEEK
jgi:predicted GNAT family acetyltransferase